MTLITITLDEDEQDTIYQLAGSGFDDLKSIAAKISRAQDTSPFEVPPPEDGLQRLEAMRRMFQEET